MRSNIMQTRIIIKFQDGNPQAGLAGTVEILGDIVTPVLPAQRWDAERSDP